MVLIVVLFGPPGVIETDEFSEMDDDEQRLKQSSLLMETVAPYRPLTSTS